MGILYLVPTPIGNLDDITLRALSVLKQASIILAEDTRTTSILLKHYDIHNPLRSYHKFNEHQTLSSIIKLLLDGETIALVSDAGTPGISDPGFLITREAIKQNIPVVCLPGPTACIPALVASGFPCDRFCFEGFLPNKKGRATRLNSLLSESRTMVFYESPHRILRTLADLCTVFGPDRPAAVCREISKVHEECLRDTLSELHRHFTSVTPRGEIVLIVSGIK